MRFYGALLKMGVRSSISHRTTFIFQSLLMLLNNMIFFVVWYFFFRQFQVVNGWNFNDMMILTAIGTGSYGVMQICFGGVHTLGRTIVEGDLDAFMTQPKNVLIHVLGSVSRLKGWGHLMTPILLLPFIHPLSLGMVLSMGVGIVCGSLVFTSAGIIAHSLVFWGGGIEGVSKKYCDSLFVFATYPTNIYKGLMQLVMFTLIPAGVIGTIPVELVKAFTLWKLLWLFTSVIASVALAVFTFYRGLRQYESGNRFGTRF